MSRSRSNASSSIFGLSTKIIIYVIITLLFLRCIAWAYEVGHSVFYSASVDEAPGRDIEVSIGAGMTPRTTAMYLREKGLITSEFSFVIQARVFGFDVVPGSYILNTSQTSREILKQLDAGKDTESTAGSKEK